MAPWELEFTREFTAAHNGSRALVLAAYMERTGYSEQQLYRIAKKHGYSSGRKSREDKGSSVITDQQVIFVAGLMQTSARENKGVIMPVGKALEIAEDNGVIPRGAVSVGRMQQLLRERQLNKDALDAETPCIEMRSLHPNHMHQIDASVCIQYYLKNGKTTLIDERDYNEKKPDNVAKIKQRLTRYLLTDHFSGAFFVKYYLTAETANTLYDFLLSAWACKQDGRYPFRGVPSMIFWDAASAAKARAMEHFISGLGIETPKGLPHNPRRQGQVETTQNIVEEWFESGLRFQPAFSVEELNSWAMDWCIYHNANKKHTRHGMKRTECWMLINKEQLRELPEKEILNAIYSYTSEDNTRLVGANYKISYALRSGESKEYSLRHIPGLLPTRTKVQVRIKPYLWPEIDVLFNDQSYAVLPVEKLPAVMGGFSADAVVIGKYKSQPETATQKAAKEIENYAYGENKGKNPVPFAGITVMGNQADKLGNMSYMPKSGTAIEFDRGIADAEISITELFKRILREGHTISKDMNQALRARYGESIKKSEAEEVIRQIGEEGFRASRNDHDGDTEAIAM